MIPFINIHTHRATDSNSIGIRNLMNPDTMEEDLQKEGHYSIGIHPWHIHPDHWREDLELVSKLASHPRVLAIGEAGLDRLTDLPMDLQQEVFSSMAQLSETAGKPLIIHAVRTHSEIAIMHNLLKPQQPWILHGFNSRQTIAKGLADKGILLSFGKALFRGDQPAAGVLKSLKEGQFFLETDEAEESISSIYQRAVEIRETSKEELTNQLFTSFNHLFRHGQS